MLLDEHAAPVAEAIPPERLGRTERAINWYMRRSAKYSNRRFIFEMLILSFVLQIIAATPLIFLEGDLTAGPTNTEQIVASDGFLALVVAALIVAPPLETVLFQWFPIWICSLFSRKNFWKIGFSSVAFALCHAPYGLLTVLAVFFPGVIFAFSFIVKRQESRWRAFWVSSLIHAAHNGVAIAAFGLMG